MAKGKFGEWFKNNIADFSKEKEEVQEELVAPPKSKKSTPWDTGTTAIAQPMVQQQQSITQLNHSTEDMGNKYRGRISKVLEETNQPGPDYFEFSNSVRSLEAMGQSVSVAMQSAFVALKTIDASLSKDKILGTVNRYISALDQDAISFAKDVEAAKVQEIGSREAEVIKLEKDVTDKQELIQKLTQEISQNNQDIQKKKLEIMQMHEKLNVNETNYNFILAATKSKITQDIQNINLYLA